MKYPLLIIDLKKIKENTKNVIKMCKERDIEVAAVTKVFAGNLKVVKSIVECGVDILADSRIQNLTKFKDIKIKKMLIRIPMMSEIEKVVKYSNISLVSEIETIIEINKYAKKSGKIYKIILMIDVGDLREGIYFENQEKIYSVVQKIIKLKNIELNGIGANFSCFGGVIPTEKKLKMLVDIKENLEKKFKIKIKTISGGSSGTLSLFNKINIPEEINQLRCGASIALGIGLNDKPFKNLYQNTCTLLVEIVEIKNKAKKYAICAIGEQEVKHEYLIPIDKNIKIVDENQDYLILDITDSRKFYKIGDAIDFYVTYGGLLSLMTSIFVEKTYISHC
ncbi:alanine racemase [Marinitoga sp. 1154]|uniref:alanine racemase n=1 Tax=Marinitoga sp. 1154 TaxID=1643335 RepID=UPI0015861B41|nr:alanine racemase [Marinitoga sp. 1154]NUU99742.1 alanine racemase [Marinitoga sp. 1154]